MMLGEHSLPSNCTGYQSRFLVFSNTGSIALRLDEVQPPNTVTTPSLPISLVAFSAKVAGSDAPSSVTASTRLRMTPPAALISRIAVRVLFFTVTSLIALVRAEEHTSDLQYL